MNLQGNKSDALQTKVDSIARNNLHLPAAILNLIGRSS